MSTLPRSDLPRIEPLGESALLLTLTEVASPETSARVAWLTDAVRGLQLPDIHDVVPAYCAVAVFLSAAADPAPVEAALRELLRSVPAAVARHESARTVRVIPVVYDGPDLADVAARTGLSTAEVIQRHSSRTYQAYFLGFMPGFAYLGPIDEALVLPRRSEPRRRVPPGSVAIAGAQTGIYPLETPGGWHLLGRTDVTLFDPARQPPSLIAVGDLVRFEPVIP
ncbi:MAG TPA: 5-oxoprolinase subunit PxpB [Gemmatimonadales bacterium]|nr:5-oxoprolinase subunit PxpB [Gemmatimonadales bacterium]